MDKKPSKLDGLRGMPSGLQRQYGSSPLEKAKAADKGVRSLDKLVGLEREGRVVRGNRLEAEAVSEVAAEKQAEGNRSPVPSIKERRRAAIHERAGEPVDALVAAAGASSKSRYRDPEARKAYMRDLMRKKREAKKAK